jgi:hypothetical protein
MESGEELARLTCAAAWFADRYLRRNFQQVFRLQASEGVLRLEEDEIADRRSKLTTVKVRCLPPTTLLSLVLTPALMLPCRAKMSGAI